MASVTTIPEHDNYLTNGYGIKSWLLTTDHKRIAMLYLASITFFFSSAACSRARTSALSC